jgi:type IV pilus assembly protein PilC
MLICMMNVTTKVLDRASHEVTDLVSPSAMARALARRQTPTPPNKSHQAPQTPAAAPATTHHKTPARTLFVFTRQWAALMTAGIPVLQAFELLQQTVVGSKATQTSFVATLQMIQTDVQAGASLHIAFQKHPRAFNSLYCSLLQAGESAGILDTLLCRLADNLEAKHAMHSKLQNALLYPACILGVASLVVTVIMVWVVPIFEDVFLNMGAVLPSPTQYLINISTFLQQWGAWGIALFISFGVIGLRAHKRSARFRLRLASFWLRLPILGPLIQSHDTTQWAQTLSSLLHAGIPILEAIGPAASASGSVHLQSNAAELRRLLQEGTALSHAMSKSKLFSNMMVQMCSIGEETGSLARMLEDAAQMMMADFHQRIAHGTTLIEPVLMVFLGSAIGGILIALYLPIFNLGQVF